jgi:ABC-type transporter Mla subunit MlaD
VAKAGVDKLLDAWHKISPVVSAVIGVVKRVVVGYVTTQVALWSKVFSTAKDAFDKVRDTVSNVISAVVDKAQAIRDKFSDVWSGVKNAATNAMDVITTPIQNIVDLVESLLDKISSIHLPDIHVPGLGRTSTTAPADSRAGGVGGTANYFDITLVGSASESQAAELMAAIDARLRMLGKSPVFS